ncbi:MAG: hypothetical protein KBA53_02460 [Thermoclostridium sp.]|nr:hypothetical protein [Thermoclostridium sp.]
MSDCANCAQPEGTYSDGSPATTWFCLMPWAAGSILDGLAGDYWDKTL